MGYLPNHPAGTWKFFDPKTRKIFKSRDVTWLDIRYGEYIKNLNARNLNIGLIVPDSHEDLDDAVSIGSLSTTEPIEENFDNMVDMTPPGFDEAGEIDPSLQDPTEANLSETSGPTENSTTYTPRLTRSKARSQHAGMTV